MKFYDYHTAPVQGTNVVDETTTGVSFYNDFLKQSELQYLRDNHNLIGDIVSMSPKQYYEQCAKYAWEHPVSVTSLIKQRQANPETINHLKDVVLVYKRKLCMPYINKANKAQEGLHRMLAIAEMFGWDHKVPVLVVDWYDPQRAEKEQQEKQQTRIDKFVNDAINDAIEYHYNSLDEIDMQLVHELTQQFEYEDNIDVPKSLELVDKRGNIDFNFNGKLYSISKDDIKWCEKSDESDDELDDFNYEDADEFLAKYFGSN